MRRRGKYNNVKVTLDGHKFDSKSEARRYVELKDQQARGLIEDLRLQVPFQLYSCASYADPDAPTRAEKVCVYKADFTYWREEEPGARTYIVEDVKGGPPTPLFNLKRKLFRLNYGYDIRVVFMGREK